MTTNKKSRTLDTTEKREAEILPPATAKIVDGDFGRIVSLIESARQNAIQRINEELITLYFNVGRELAEIAQEAEYGDRYIDELARFITRTHPDLKGFTRRGLYRMRQFYETYRDDSIVSALLTQLSWTNHLTIMSRTKSKEERQFYVTLAAKEHYSTRELERQINSLRFERFMVSRKTLEPMPVSNETKSLFLDSYVLDFLNLPEQHRERDLQQSVTQNLKKFILEVGRDFTFVGEEFKVQVGKSDFFIDLLFYHRGLLCLVAFELKVDAFKPEYLGKMNFYLEALDRDYKKPNENMSVGIILCTSKDDEVVEYALSRNLSPTMIAEYTTQLPSKELLQNKLRELTKLATAETGDEESPE